MAIYELGIIKNGILIFSKKYYTLDAEWESKLEKDQNLRSQLLSSIIHFANNCLSTEVEYFVMRKYRIATASSQVTGKGMKNFVVTYLIVDNDLGVDAGCEYLRNLLHIFINEYKDQFEIVEDTIKFVGFETTLERVLGTCIFARWIACGVYSIRKIAFLTQ